MHCYLWLAINLALQPNVDLFLHKASLNQSIYITLNISQTWSYTHGDKYRELIEGLYVTLNVHFRNMYDDTRVLLMKGRVYSLN